ncbi:hypothetical protein H2204_011720 [Knufia peltigerae]|uniref:Uncharacterized protein n=1 Tax=Knufia peltigerae TaxID=1002370 RepID=A0AA39CTN7_9EURO|nr:hypothetical protein H2204_011720 [Knufia peltigerae]
MDLEHPVEKWIDDVESNQKSFSTSDSDTPEQAQPDEVYNWKISNLSFLLDHANITINHLYFRLRVTEQSAREASRLKHLAMTEIINLRAALQEEKTYERKPSAEYYVARIQELVAENQRKEILIAYLKSAVERALSGVLDVGTSARLDAEQGAQSEVHKDDKPSFWNAVQLVHTTMSEYDRRLTLFPDATENGTIINSGTNSYPTSDVPESQRKGEISKLKRKRATPPPRLPLKIRLPADGTKSATLLSFCKQESPWHTYRTIVPDNEAGPVVIAHMNHFKFAVFAIKEKKVVGNEANVADGILVHLSTGSSQKPQLAHLLFELMEPGTYMANPQGLTLANPSKWSGRIKGFLEAARKDALCDLTKEAFLETSPGPGCLIPYVEIVMPMLDHRAYFAGATTTGVERFRAQLQLAKQSRQNNLLNQNLEYVRENGRLRKEVSYHEQRTKPLLTFYERIRDLSEKLQILTQEVEKELWRHDSELLESLGVNIDEEIAKDGESF